MTAADPATILVVEDDEPTRTFLAATLPADGYELLVADNAADGLAQLETKFPDLALIDLGLPDRSGLEVIARVRASDGVASRIDPAVPIVVLTGRAGELDRLRGFERKRALGRTMCLWLPTAPSTPATCASASWGPATSTTCDPRRSSAGPSRRWPSAKASTWSG